MLFIFHQIYVTIFISLIFLFEIKKKKKCIGRQRNKKYYSKTCFLINLLYIENLIKYTISMSSMMKCF